MLEFVLILLCWFLLMIVVPVVLNWIFDNVVSDTFGGVATGWLAILGLFTLVIGLWVLVVWACGYL